MIPRSSGRSSVRTAFDRHAIDYDRTFSDTPLARAMRARSWRIMDRCLAPGQRVLDLGCGTGDDALHLASRGLWVHAVDLSEAMVERLTGKARDQGVLERIACSAGDCGTIELGTQRFDCILSNFGSLNCVSDLDFLKRLVEKHLNRDGCVIVGLMGRFYPLEFAVNLLSGRWRTALRRWKRRGTATVSGIRFDVYYHTIDDVSLAIGPDCRLAGTEALGLIVPSPGLDHLDDRYPRVFSALEPLDAWLGGRLPLMSIGDHVIAVWRRD